MQRHSSSPSTSVFWRRLLSIPVALGAVAALTGGPSLGAQARPARAGGVAAWTGRQLLVWGGSGSTNGAIYTPAHRLDRRLVDGGRLGNRPA